MDEKVKKLKETIEFLLADWYQEIEWGDLWKKPIENGLAFQIAILSSVVYAAREAGLNIDSPVLEARSGDMFLLRNEIPLSHNAQAGNSATMLANKPLWKRFLFSLVPKFTFIFQSIPFLYFPNSHPHERECRVP